MIEVVMGILEDQGEILLIERPLEAEDFAGMIGFPGGRQTPQETPEGACKRIFRSETWVEVDDLKKLGEVYQTIAGDGKVKHVHITVFEIREIEKEEGHVAHRAFWHDAEHLDSLEIVPSNISIFERMHRDKEWGQYESRVRKQRGEYVQTAFHHV